MKTGKFIISIIAMLIFIGLNETFGQWLFNGNHIYNTNTQNVGIGTGLLWTPTEKLHVNNALNSAGIMAESSYAGATQKAYGYFRIKSTASGDMFNLVLRRRAGRSEMLQSCYDASTATWREYTYFDFANYKYEMRAGIGDVEYMNSGNLLFNNSGNVGIDITPDDHGLNVLNYNEGKAAVQGLDQEFGITYASGMLGILNPQPMGVPVYAYNAGVLGIKHNNGGNGAAVYGWNLDAGNTANYGGIFVADGAATTTDYTNFGVYGLAKKANINFAGKFLGRVEVDGHPSSTEAADYTSTVFKATTNHTIATDTRAIEGISVPAPGYGYGVYAEGGYRGVYGFANGAGYTGTTIGVYGYSSGTAGTRYGVYGYGYNPGGTNAIGVFGTASDATNNWAGYFSGDCYISSDLRIGTTTQATGYALSVNGKVACEEVLVEDLGSWPDYVFAEDYDLMSLDELEKSIQKNKHLPGLPSASEVEENGLMLGDMQKRIMEKVEELTLYTIEQGKMINELQQKMDKLEKENARLRKHSK